MRRIISLALALSLLGGSASVAAADREDRPKDKVVISRTAVSFAVDLASINPANGDFDYVGHWSGRVTGDIEGTIEGTQTGTINFLQGTVTFQDTWTITGKGGAKIEGSDHGVSTLEPAIGTDNLAATYRAESQIVSADRRYTRFEGCRGGETGNYYVYQPNFLFAGTMQGDLHLTCAPGKSDKEA